jgi:hypothetical protein
MSDSVNPWQSPQNPSVPDKSRQGAALSEPMITYLKQASPWLRFIGILGFIGAGLICLFGILSAVFSSVGAVLAENLGFLPAGFISLVYVALAALTFFPARFTYLFGDKLRAYMHSGADWDLEQAFRNNKSLWKFTGILCIIYLAIIPVGIIGVIIAAVSAARF